MSLGRATQARALQRHRRAARREAALAVLALLGTVTWGLFLAWCLVTAVLR